MEWLRKLAKSWITWLMVQIVMFIAIGSAVSLLTLWTLAKMARNGAFAELTGGMGHIDTEKLIVLLVMTVAMWRIMEMLYKWCEGAVEEQFSDVRHVEFTKTDLDFIIGALEEFQAQEAQSEDNETQLEAIRQIAGDNVRRAGQMIGYLVYYAQ